MLPEIDHILHILQRMQQEVVAPFLPVDGHRAVTVHAGGVGQGGDRISAGAGRRVLK